MHPFRWKLFLISWTVLAVFAASSVAEVVKDVPFVPTPQEVVNEMLRLAAPKEGEVLYDLGCGDGRIVITAAQKYHVQGIGVDIDPERIRECNVNAAKAGVTDRVEFLQQNLFEMDFSDADVLCMYLLTTVNAKLKPKILADMKPGARVVSHAFSMGDWEADQTVQVKDAGNRTVYFWIVPARVEGTSKVMLETPQGQQEATLELTQSYQYVNGTAKTGDKELRIDTGKLVGDKLEFHVDTKRYTCRIPAKTGPAKVEK